MVAYRITKYDPAKRDANGTFTGDEWTSVSDVGKRFSGKLLTVQDYLAYEDAYIAAIQDLLSSAGVSCLRIVGLEGPADASHVPTELRSLFDRECSLLVEGKVVSGSELEAVCRLVLREVAWGKLEGDRGFYIHFGYDYYLYVGFSGAAPPLANHGLFFEARSSPYA